MRSRLPGAYSMTTYGSRPFAALLGGFTAEHLGIAPTLVVAGLTGSRVQAAVGRVIWRVPLWLRR